MSDSEVFELVKTCLDCYISLPPGGVKKDKDETYEDHLESESFMKITQDALQDVMCQIVTKDPTPDGLDSVFKVWLNSLSRKYIVFYLSLQARIPCN